MTGPEHYREAERLLAAAAEDVNIGSEEERYSLAAAQVHATLALAAATLAAAEHTGHAAYEVAGNVRPGLLVVRPHPGDEVDPPFPGNDWGRAIYGEVASR